MIVLKTLLKILLEIIDLYIKVMGCKISIQKFMAFLYAKKNKKRPFTSVLQNNKYRGISLTGGENPTKYYSKK